MATLYYRKIAEIVRRDENEPAVLAAAGRVAATGREGKSRIAKADRRLLKAWMYRWCDVRAPAPSPERGC